MREFINPDSNGNARTIVARYGQKENLAYFVMTDME